MKTEAKTNKLKIEFSEGVYVHAWETLCAHNQACLHRQDYAYMGSYSETLETQQRLRMLNLTS